MIELGRVCIKTTGRDAGKYGVIVDVQDKKKVLLDGNVRRKQVNIMHIEPLGKVVSIKKRADTKEVLGCLEKLGIKITKGVEVKKKSEPKEQVRKDKKDKTKKVVEEKKK